MKSEFNAVGLDWTMKPEDMRQLDSEKVLQGNLDPCLLYANDDEIVNKTNEMLNSFSGGAHIANLGHGVYPDTEWQKVKLFIDTIKNSSN